MSGDKGNVLAEMDAIDRGPGVWLILCVWYRGAADQN
jgi:hypothetical protein